MGINVAGLRIAISAYRTTVGVLIPPTVLIYNLLLENKFNICLENDGFILIENA